MWEARKEQDWQIPEACLSGLGKAFFTLRTLQNGLHLHLEQITYDVTTTALKPLSPLSEQLHAHSRL